MSLVVVFEKLVIFVVHILECQKFDWEKTTLCFHLQYYFFSIFCSFVKWLYGVWYVCIVYNCFRCHWIFHVLMSHWSFKTSTMAHLVSKMRGMNPFFRFNFFFVLYSNFHDFVFDVQCIWLIFHFMKFLTWNLDQLAICSFFTDKFWSNHSFTLKRIKFIAVAHSMCVLVQRCIIIFSSLIFNSSRFLLWLLLMLYIDILLL